MAIKVNFFDNTDYDYFASDFNAQFQSIVSDNGVSGDDDLKIIQTSPASLGVQVSVGSAWIDGFFIRNDAPINLSIPINSSSTKRKDYIVLEIDKQNKTATAKRTETLSDGVLLLATVTMDNTNTSVVQGLILDERQKASTKLPANVANEVEWSGVKNKPSSYPPTSHDHPYLPTNHPSSSFGYNGSTGRITHNGNDVKVLNSANADNSTKWGGMQVRGGNYTSGASGFITFGTV